VRRLEEQLEGALPLLQWSGWDSAAREDQLLKAAAAAGHGRPDLA